ncbi:MAG TPA: sugar phosphate isomerase/epimerase [Candidatus Blautia avistercoris]|nr:sugar phosphate isomerase/epimerase [Candidatus Blautia avistercoris]
MRYGCCLNMVAKGEDKTGIEWIETLAEMGFDYAELPLAEIMMLSEAEFKAFKKKVRKSGIACEVCNNFFPGSLRLTGEQVSGREVRNYVRKALRRAREMGTQILVFGSGPAKNIPEGFPFQKGYEQIVNLLREISRPAREWGITIVIEPLRKEECNIINTFEEGCRLSRRINQENVKVLVDFYHLSEEKEPVEHIAEEGETYLRHVHFAEPMGRVYPRQAKESSYQPFFQALKTAGYDGRISLEAYSRDFEKDAAVSLALLKKAEKGF